VCPYYLDGDLLGGAFRLRPVIPIIHWLLCSFQGPRRALASPASPAGPEGSPRARRRGRSLKAQQHAPDPGTMCAGAGLQARSTCLVRMRSRRSRPVTLAGPVGDLGIRRPPNGGLPRKEVIQPQLPLRLPCYDFTPVTSPTFDGSLPKGLGHRLRVLLTPVV
jgi:hypothetical protein